MQENQNVEKQSDGYIFQQTQRSVDVNYALLPMPNVFFFFFSFTFDLSCFI